jgi:hypothetical protein
VWNCSCSAIPIGANRVRYDGKKPYLQEPTNPKHDDDTQDRTHEQRLGARLDLLKQEKQLTRCSGELARHGPELPWVRIRFETDEGSASLADLF